MEVINAIGRRKSAVARVYVTEGTGKITINKKDITVFFPSAILQYMAKDIEGRDVFLADSGYVLSMAQQDFEHIKFHFTSEF